MAFLLPALGFCGLASCVTSGVCAVGRACCCAVGAASGRAGAKLSARSAKAGHILIMAISAIAALVLFNYGDQITWLSSISVLNQLCTGGGQYASQCYGASAALRISLALCVYFAVNVLTAFAAEAFVGWWGLKLLLWLALVIGSFFVPATAIAQYGQTSRVFSTLFLLAMVIILIDFAYHAHEWLMAKADASDARLRETHDEVGLFQNCWKLLYLALAAGAIIASFAGIIVLYHFSANRPTGIECGTNLGFLSITLIAGIIFLIVAPLECAGARGILPPALIFAYCTWLCWSAIYGNSNADCTPIPPDTTNTGATVVGMIIAALSLCYTAFSASRSIPHLFDTGKKAASAAAVADGSAAGVGARAGSADESDSLTAHDHHVGADKLERGTGNGSAEAYDDAAAAKKKADGEAAAAAEYSVVDALIFTSVMVLAAMYMSPVMTNWVADPGDVSASRSSPATMWVNIVSQWATILLFAWTLLAPKICTSRDFS